VFGIDERAVGPQFVCNLLSSQQLAGPAQKHQQYLKWLRVQLDAHALSTKFARLCVRFKCSEAIAPWRLRIRPDICHDLSPIYPILSEVYGRRAMYNFP
jgi:hypothetical protein